MTQQLSNIHPLFHINGGAKPGCVSLVGAGPGDPDLLTVKALRLIEQRQVVVSNAARVHETAEALRSEFGSEILAPWNITVNAFCPGIIESDMWDYNDRVWG